MTVLGAMSISRATSNQPPLPPWRLGSGLHCPRSVEGGFGVTYQCLFQPFYFKLAKPRGPIMDIKGVGTLDARRGFCNQTMWHHGDGSRVRISSRLGLVPDYVVLVLGNEGGGLIICKIIIHAT